MSPRPGPGWTTRARLDIASALLDAGNAPLVPSELARPSRRDPSNVRDEAEALAGDGYLVRTAAPPRRGPGAKAKCAYVLPEDQVTAVRQLVAPGRARPGEVRAGQRLIFADARRTGDLFAVLATARGAAETAWSALLDGEPQEYLLAFDESRLDSALDLVRELQGADVRCRHVHVTVVDAPADLRRRTHGNGDAAPDR